MPEVPVKPEVTNTMPPETVGPLPLIDPPCAFTPFTVATLDGQHDWLMKSKRVLEVDQLRRDENHLRHGAMDAVKDTG